MAMVKYAFRTLFELERIKTEEDLKFEMRVGLHTGPCIGGVIGALKPRCGLTAAAITSCFTALLFFGLSMKYFRSLSGAAMVAMAAVMTILLGLQTIVVSRDPPWLRTTVSCIDEHQGQLVFFW